MSTCVPSAVTIFPLMEILRSLINLSAFRREAMPAIERNLFSRIMLSFLENDVTQDFLATNFTNEHEYFFAHRTHKKAQKIVRLVSLVRC